MNINPGMVAPLAFKNIVDLSKNTPTVKELLSAILKAVEHVGAHKIFSQKCKFCSCPFLRLFIIAHFSFYIFFICSATMDSGCGMLFKWGTIQMATENL
jgi:hypothetical protein